MFNDGWKNFFRKAIPMTGCSGGDFSKVSLFWKIILFSGLAFIVVFIIFFGVSKDIEIKEISLQNASSTNLMVNRSSLSEIFDLYKKQEELFNSNIKSLNIIVDPS